MNVIMSSNEDDLHAKFSKVMAYVERALSTFDIVHIYLPVRTPRFICGKVQNSDSPRFRLTYANCHCCPYTWLN